MNRNLFSKLLRLYRSNLVRVPVEDFITEIFAGVLSSDQELLDDYINNFLAIDGKRFTAKTQVSYPKHNSIIDMVFENEDTIIFIENKVGSTEGTGQLEKYSLILGTLTKHSYLVYCTKYVEKKNKEIYEKNSGGLFIQCRWAEIHDYLANNTESQISDLFINFMEQEKLSNIDDFDIQDILSMQNIYGTIQKMEECLQLVSPKLSETFGAPYTRDFASLKQIQRHSRYAIWKEKILTGKGYSEILISFELKEDLHPSIVVGIWCNKKNKQHLELPTAHNAHCSDALIKEYDSGTSIWYETNLLAFLESSSQFTDIKKWIEDHITKFHKLKEITQVNGLLDWR